MTTCGRFALSLFCLPGVRIKTMSSIVGAMEVVSVSVSVSMSVPVSESTCPIASRLACHSTHRDRCVVEQRLTHTSRLDQDGPILVKCPERRGGGGGRFESQAFKVA